MRLSMWEDFKKMALTGSTGEKRKIPVALIVDSPWLPGFMGISTLDYFTAAGPVDQGKSVHRGTFPGSSFPSGPLDGVWNGSRAFCLRMQDQMVEKQPTCRDSFHS